MARAVNMSPLGLFNWDNSLFDLMVIPSALDKETLVNNLLAETAELEVLYPNPVVFKNLLGVWSHKQLDIWNRLYATTQYDYNPIENYNRYETGSTDGTGSTTHSGTDTTTDNTALGGANTRTESIVNGGQDSSTHQNAEGGTETEQTTGQLALGGQDVVTLADTKGHWIAGFDSTPSGTDDGLVKQTRDQDDGTTTTAYGRTESTNGSKTTTFGKTNSGNEATTYGKTEYVNENTSFGQTVNKTGSMTHGEEIKTSQEGTHDLHAHGNIGITTTQKLIREQREIDLFNLYDIIIENFKMRFCILVY